MKDARDYIAFFDLDRTISKAISGREMAVASLRKGIIPWKGLGRILLHYAGYKTGLVSQEKIISSLVGLLKNIPEEALEELSREVYLKSILPGIFPQVRKEIAYHHSCNAATVIVSSSLNHVCRHVAEELVMDDILCTTLASEGGFLTGYPSGPLCFGAEKAVRMRDYCIKTNTRLEEAWYYGDSFSDLDALSAAGNRVCVNPERKLQTRARHLGWNIVNWNS